MKNEPKLDRKEDGLDLNKINERVILDGIFGRNQTPDNPEIKQRAESDKIRDNLSGIYAPMDRNGLYSD